MESDGDDIISGLEDSDSWYDYVYILVLVQFSFFIYFRIAKNVNFSRNSLDPGRGDN